MKVQLERNGEIFNITNLVIEIDGNVYRLSKNNTSELVINKAPMRDEDLFIMPACANEVRIK